MFCTRSYTPVNAGCASIIQPIHGHQRERQPRFPRCERWLPRSAILPFCDPLRSTAFLPPAAANRARSSRSSAALRHSCQSAGRCDGTLFQPPSRAIPAAARANPLPSALLENRTEIARSSLAGCPPRARQSEQIPLAVFDRVRCYAMAATPKALEDRTNPGRGHFATESLLLLISQTSATSQLRSPSPELHSSSKCPLAVASRGIGNS